MGPRSIADGEYGGATAARTTSMTTGSVEEEMIAHFHAAWNVCHVPILLPSSWVWVNTVHHLYSPDLGLGVSLGHIVVLPIRYHRAGSRHSTSLLFDVEGVGRYPDAVVAACRSDH
ncbi:hypothetical protein ACLOJK_006639 [Asimina triloba]